MNEIDNIIAQLERQKATIDNAVEVLRSVSGIAAAAPVTKKQGRRAKAAKKGTGGRRLSPEGRKRLSENMRKRWATKRAGSFARKKGMKKG